MIKRKSAYKKVSYVKKPFAKKSLWSIGLIAVGMLLMLTGMLLSVNAKGTAGPNAAACGLSSMLFTLLGMWYGINAFVEEEKNYILAKISLASGGVLILYWIIIIIIGFRK